MAARAYFEGREKVLDFISWVAWMAASIDRNAEKAHSVLLKLDLESAKDESTRQAVLEKSAAFKNRKTMTDELKRHRQYLMEVALCRLCENYENYLSSLLLIVCVSKPETMRSSETVKVDMVLSHKTMEEFIEQLAEDKVHSLSYSSFEKLASHFLDRFKIRLLEKDKEAPVIEAIETRNISVHNRCIINKRYLSRTGKDVSRLGKTRSLGIADIENLDRLLTESVISVDRQARRKLNLRGIQFARARPTGP